MLAQWEMLIAFSRVWTRVVKSISYDDDRYTRSAFIFEKD